MHWVGGGEDFVCGGGVTTVFEKSHTTSVFQ